MSQPGGPLELGPTIITVPISPPNPPLPLSPVGVPGGLGDRPPVWDRNVPTSAQVEDFFNKKDIFSLNKIQAVVLTVAAGQRNVEASYVAHLPNMPYEVDYEINSSVGTEVLSPLEKAKKEKAVVDQLITVKQSELGVSTVAANSYFGRNPLDKDADLNGVDFLIRFQNPKNPISPLALYNEFISSVSAAYTSKILTEKIRLLTEKSTALTSSIAIKQAAEDARLAAEAEAQRVTAEAAEQARLAAEAEAQRVAAVAAEQARLAAEAEAQRVAAEAARLAAEAEAQRVAAEAAEQARLAAEAEAAEQARLAAEAEAKRVADEAAAAEAARVAAEAEAQRIADEAAAVEAARVAAEAAEQARLAAEAEAQRVAAEAAAEQARVAAEAVRIANTFRAPGPASAAGPLFMTSAGTVAVVEAAAVTLQAAIRAAITALGGVVASVGAGLVVGVSALFYSSKLANGELPERYAFSTPVSDLASDLGQDLNAVAAAGGTVDLPYRISSKTAADGRSEVFVVKTDGVTVPSKVRVVAATYDTTQKIYTATTADVPPRTLTWTPIVNPGNSSTTSPAEQPAPPVYTGATVTPVEGRIDTFPAVSEASFDDFITVFPADSGLPPIYTMFRDRREDPGVATGVGQPVSGLWLGAASHGEGAPIPSQIADQLRGKEFKNFREFRETFWKAVANDPELAKQFSSVNLARMKNNGYAPYAIPSEQVGGKIKFELHHVIFLKNHGELYGIDNLRVVTPKEHDALHTKKSGE